MIPFLSKMENSQIGVQSVTRDTEEDVSKRKDDDDVEDVEETPEVAGVEDDEKRRLQWQGNEKSWMRSFPDESTSAHEEASSTKAHRTLQFTSV